MNGPFLGRGIFGSGWQRQNWTLDSFDELDFKELDEAEGSFLPRSAVMRGTTRVRDTGEVDTDEAVTMAGFAKLTGEVVIAGSDWASSRTLLPGMAFRQSYS
jgi:hypothetical protein